ncbi:MAG TPA: flagellar biosynthesis protein FlhA [Hyphomonadaceae bacterium]|jgi:flagellar biosynthesis protein FlhA|nr:flagellar biosynthesis protein FlhA [Hyphomonadaceae bacterium]
MIKSLLSRSREFSLAFGMLFILTVLFTPIPPMALDLAILINFGFSLTVLLLTFYVAKPVEFSTFPSLLLITTLLRLSLNVAATRLILTSGHAGEVIDSVGSFAVAGNFVVGLVVFLILVVVQYVVVTSGAQRVSEVAARFTLDSMPGQQMSIDADLNMGLIDQKEAVRRRAALEKEASFYGAMDGASKFVKGDAIAGVIILLINIIAGWIIGVSQMGMTWQEALQRFTLLTVGDGICSQLPALVVSIATGIIVTRSSADKELSTEVLRQLSSVPRILLIVAVILSLLLLMPGMPKWPIAILGAGGVWGWLHLRRRPQAEAEAAETGANDSITTPSAPGTLAVAFGKTLGESWTDKNALIMERITTLRQTHEKAFGVGFPAVRMIDGPDLQAQAYEIRIFGSRYASGEIHSDRMLAIRNEQSRTTLNGIAATDPAFGLPAVWIEEADVADARKGGVTVIDPITVFTTHLQEVLRTAAPTLLTRATVQLLLDDVRGRQPGLVEELIPNLLTFSDVQRVLQNFLSEGIAISPLDLIAEHLVDLARTEKDLTQLTELLRQRMSHSICDRLRGRHDDLAVISLDPRLENQIQASLAATGKKDSILIDPKLADKMIRKLAAMTGDLMREGREPVLLCGAEIRRAIRAFTRRSIPRLAVLSVSEIPTHIELRSHGVVRFDNEDMTPKTQSPQRVN